MTGPEKAETFEEMCARLGFELDTETSGSEVIFAGKRLAEKLQAQSRAADAESCSHQPG